jgi:hypothetical protein
MSFTNLSYDNGAYSHTLNESIGPGEYMLDRPFTCQPCFVRSPEIRMNFGGSVCEKDLIDVDSELLGITRKATKCPGQKYLPSDKEFCKKTHYKDCESTALEPEPSRLSNPPCTLRCRGWNRWEWLCRDPQENVFIPFDTNISERTNAKDRHRPCLPKPLDQSSALPEGKTDNQMYKEYFCGMPKDTPPVHWQGCKNIQKL